MKATNTKAAVCVEGMRVMQEMQSSRLVCLAVCKRCRQLLNGLLSFNPGADCKSLELPSHQPTHCPEQTGQVTQHKRVGDFLHACSAVTL